MARFLASLALLFTALYSSHAHLAVGDVWAQGTGSNLEDRESDEYTYIPNYGDSVCAPFISYDAAGLMVYDKAGAIGSTSQNPPVPAQSCCRNKTSPKQGCGPEFWPFAETLDFDGVSPGNSFYRCQSKNSLITGSVGDFLSKGNNQQTPINIQTSGNFRNQKMAFYDITDITSGVAHPPSDSGRTPTGLDFSTSEKRTFYWTPERCPAKASLKKGTFQVDLKGGKCKQLVYIGGKTYELLQFHFHNSEHTVNGMYYPLEAHFVHAEYDKDTEKSDLSKLMVLGVFLTPGPGQSSFMATLIKDHKAQKPETQVTPYKLITPIKNSYWHYLGSLTTPPCQTSDKGYVRWFVFKNPIPVSIEQAQYLSSAFNILDKSYNGQNNRPVQPLLPTTRVYSYGPDPAVA